jgi:methylmalonyl-CoA mutase C-terminal domain/subunit
MEVVYTGLHQTCESIVEAAIQEDVDVVGLSILSGAHMTLFPKVLTLLKKQKAGDIIVIGGGIIPQDDMKKLEKHGVKKLFGPGTPTTEIVAWIEKNVAAKTPTRGGKTAQKSTKRAAKPKTKRVRKPAKKKR